MLNDILHTGSYFVLIATFYLAVVGAIYIAQEQPKPRQAMIYRFIFYLIFSATIFSGVITILTFAWSKKG